MPDEEKKIKDYKPSDKDLKRIEFVYDEFDEMIEVRNKTYREFNDRTLVQFLDDSQKRANGYVPSKESQGKQEWQANIFTKTTRNKIKSILAPLAKDVPEFSVTAYNTKNQTSVDRANVIKDINIASYIQSGDNPEMTIMLDGWNLCINGTVIKYDGYLKTKEKIELIKSYDLTTGEIEVEEKEEIVEDRPIEINVPLQNLFIKDMYCSDIQDQSALIWVEYMDREHVENEFNDYKNFKFVPPSSTDHSDSETQTFFLDRWQERVGKDQERYEVIRYYNKIKNKYCIIINGVLMLDAPMLWGKRKKFYPFAKQVLEPMANSSFFYGNSLPNILMDEQDAKNAMVNSMLDKAYRSVVPPMLIGMTNKDSFDLEDEYVNQDTHIYVEDINQVTPMPVSAISQGEMSMLEIINRGLDNDSVDNVQGGQSGSGSTAREIVIANERAEELKGLFYTMLKDLWLQKLRIRTVNNLMHYNSKKVRMIVGEDGEKVFEETYKVFKNPNTALKDGTMGERQIEVVGSANELARPFELDKREEMARIEGQNVAIVQVTSDFLDEWEYEIKMVTQSFHQKSRALDAAIVEDRMKTVATLFQPIFLANMNKFFENYMKESGENPDPYLENLIEQQTQQAMAFNPAQGQGMGQSGGVPPAAGAPALPALNGT